MTDSARIHTWGCDRHKEDTYEGCYSCDLEHSGEVSSKLLVANARISELQTGLQYILNASGNECENYTSGIGSCFRDGRTPDAKYGADRCCWSCLAHSLMESATK